MGATWPHYRIMCFGQNASVLSTWQFKAVVICTFSVRSKKVSCAYLITILCFQKVIHGTGKWLSLDAELVMRDGQVVGTKTSTGHELLIDARFELPYGKLNHFQKYVCNNGKQWERCIKNKRSIHIAPNFEMLHITFNMNNHLLYYHSKTFVCKLSFTLYNSQSLC